MRRRRGHILLVVLLVFMLMMALVSGVASTAYLVQRSVDEYTRQRVAENLGDSLLATAVAHLREDSSYADRLELSQDQAQGWLTFDPKDPQHSTNNILGDGAQEGLAGSVVPAGTAELVAVTQVRGRKFRSLAVIGKSPFPYVVASSGAFTSTGSLLLGALRSLDDLKDGLSVEDLVKGSLLANSALTITGPAEVVGDLKTASTASLTGVNQTGKLEENAKPEDIPVIRLADYDPAGKPEIIEFTPARRPNPNAPLNLSGLARSNGNLTLNQGLTLNGGVLYVDGDLTLSGGVDGYGAVFCTGTLSVSGGGSLATDSLCALVAGGDLEISGAGAEKTQFHGLVYSAGALSVRDITVVGSLVGSSASGAPMTVVRSNLLFDPAAVVMDLDLQWSGFDLVFPRSGGASLLPGSLLTPTNIYNKIDKRFDTPTLSQVESVMEFHLWEKPPRRFLDLTADEKEAVAVLVSEKHQAIVNQIEQWNLQGLTPDTSSASFHLDLNRFVKLQSRMKVLNRRFERI